MSAPAFADALLKDVSRSFYISLRVLPGGVREVLSLGYLLARATDTVADCGPAAPGERLAALRALGAAVAGAGGYAGVAPGGATPGERALLGRVPELLAWLEGMGPADRADVRRVLGRIVEGQASDLERAGPVADAAALELYADRVAGCVGEFWTEVCWRHVPRYGRREKGEMIEAGVAFGKGLQLVNILRDLPADEAAGRQYLPGGRGEFEAWRCRALEWVGRGADYIDAVRPARLRYACLIPWGLAVRTLERLRGGPGEGSEARVKVPRGEVYRMLFGMVPAAFSAAAFGRVRRELRGA